MSDNSAFKDDDDLAKEAVSLLAITEEDGDLPDLLVDSWIQAVWRHFVILQFRNANYFSVSTDVNDVTVTAVFSF